MNTLTVEKLGKRYYIPDSTVTKVREKPSLNLGFAKLPLPTWNRGMRTRELWALRDVSFNVQPGTVLGVIGPNGAGKSTLLKVLARVVRPTEGLVVGRGRVVSLLELGAGFSQDLSARENIFMNAAMHGIPRQEVLQRLDEIVSFAEVEDFLDAGVRHYSSGMYLRLAFSVAVNMNPNILLADEILAVGDMAFQQRCLQRVAEDAKRGLTVLFVSHDMAAISRLCDQCLWLDEGRVRGYGDAPQVVSDYERAMMAPTKIGEMDEEREGGAHVNRNIEILSVRLISAVDGRVIGGVPIAEDTLIRIRVKALRTPVSVRALIDVQAKNILAFRALQPAETMLEERGTYDFIARIPANLLAETAYTVHVNINTSAGKEGIVILQNALQFIVYGTDDTALFKGGVVAPRLEWTVEIPQLVEAAEAVEARG